MHQTRRVVLGSGSLAGRRRCRRAVRPLRPKLRRSFPSGGARRVERSCRLGRLLLVGPHRRGPVVAAAHFRAVDDPRGGSCDDHGDPPRHAGHSSTTPSSMGPGPPGLHRRPPLRRSSDSRGRTRRSGPRGIRGPWRAADRRRHGEILDEALTVIDALWSGEAVDHEGAYFKIDGVCFRPRPLQRPRIPIWCAASLPSRAGVRRGARWDGVAPMYSAPGEMRPATPEEVASVLTELQRFGRAEPPDVVVWAIAPSAELRLSYARAGATWLIEGPAPGPTGWRTQRRSPLQARRARSRR